MLFIISIFNSATRAGYVCSVPSQHFAERLAHVTPKSRIIINYACELSWLWSWARRNVMVEVACTDSVIHSATIYWRLGAIGVSTDGSGCGEPGTDEAVLSGRATSVRATGKSAQCTFGKWVSTQVAAVDSRFQYSEGKTAEKKSWTSI